MVRKEGSGRPPRFNSPDELWDQADDYLSKAERPTMAGLCGSMGITKQIWHNYAVQEEYTDTVQLIKQRVETRIEEIMLYEKNQAGAIFWLKNHADYKDTMHTDNTHRGRFVVSDSPIDEAEWQKQNN